MLSRQIVKPQHVGKYSNLSENRGSEIYLQAFTAWPRSECKWPPLLKTADVPGVSTHWTAQQLRSDDLTKKDPINFSQDDAAHSFLDEHRLLGSMKNVAKTTKKAQLVDVITSYCQQRSTQR
ncbi:uncharacterized protein LOC144092116 [Stigmatopora argus]